MRKIKRHSSAFLSYSTLRQFWLIFGAAIFIRAIACIFLIHTRGVLTIADPADYIQYAQYILDQGVFVLNIEGLRAHAGPGYPLLVALNFIIAGDNSYWFALLLNIIFSSIAVPIVYFIGRKFLKHEWAFLATLWYLVYVPQIWQVQFLGKENIVFGLFTLCIYALIILDQAKRIDWKWILVFSISYFYLIHSDERYFFYLPFFLIFLLWGKSTWQTNFKKASWLTVAIFLLMVPWTYRNYLVFKRPVILTERTAKFTDKLLGYEAPPNPYRNRWLLFQPGTPEGNAYYLSAADSIANGLQPTHPRANGYVLMYLKKGISEGNYPKAYSPLEEKWSYFTEFWRPARFQSGFYGHGFRYFEKWNPDRWIFSVLQYGVLLPFLVLGVYVGMKRMDRVALFLSAIIFIHCIIHVILANNAFERYRLPIDPFIILLAFLGLSVLYLQNKHLTGNSPQP
ncbi:MAG: hypothetical protein CV087_16950 [Candidatus Brocadia sp. WS118]|nr:MAG: hypothetical protein CV087_16950 [Candidatus Brocadia sp. WS118]